MRWMLLALVMSAFAGSAVTAAEWPKRVPRAEERGRELYDRHCVSCHGDAAQGDGPAAADLITKVPDLSKGFEGRDRDTLVKAVMIGAGAMPGFEQVFRDLKPAPSKGYVDDAHAVLDHMAKIGKEAGKPKDQRRKPPPKVVDDEEDEDDVGDAP